MPTHRSRSFPPIRRHSLLSLMVCLALLGNHLSAIAYAAVPDRAQHVPTTTVWTTPTIDSPVTWTAAGSPYWVQVSVTVQATGSLTIEPGVVVKFAGSKSLTVDGTLVVQGTAGNPVVFTSERDDSYGGDTNGDGGATLPARGNWGGIIVRSPLTVGFDHARVRYATNALRLEANNSGETLTPTITGSILEESSSYGLYLYASSSSTTVAPALQDTSIVSATQRGLYGYAYGSGSTVAPALASCQIAHNGTGAHMNAGEGETATVSLQDTALHDNTKWPLMLQGNGWFADLGGVTVHNNGYSAVSVSGTLYEDRTWMSWLGLPYWLDSDLTVAVGATLTLPAGLVVKGNSGAELIVQGALDLHSTSLDPIVFTSHSDDDHGGDTNGDGGSTAPARGNWGGVTLSSNSTAGFHNALIRYASNGLTLKADAVGEIVSVPVSRCTIEESSGYGLYLYASSSGTTVAPTVQDTSIVSATQRGLYGYAYGSGSTVTPALEGCQIAHNGTGAHMNAGDGETAMASLQDTALHDNAKWPLMLQGNGWFADLGGVSVQDNRYSAIGTAGALYENRTWTAWQGMPYWLDTDLTVEAGATLTLSAGVVIKGSSGADLIVEGTLELASTPSNPVIMTSYRDDAYGGDTNGDGSLTAPAPGNWSGLLIIGPTTDQVHDLLLRYGTLGLQIRTSGSALSPLVRDTRLLDNLTYGIYVYADNGNADPEIRENLIARNREGIRINADTGSVASPLIQYNDIYSNTTYGVNNLETNSVNAQFNWWGHPSGPHHIPGNPTGGGDAVSDFVDYANWLTGRHNLYATIEASPVEGLAPLAVAFQAHVAGGTPPYDYGWDWESDGTIDAHSAASEHTYALPGTFTARLVVSDTAGGVARDQVTVLVSPFVVEVATQPNAGVVPLPVAFASLVDGGNPPFAYRWDVDGDGVVDYAVSDPTHVYTAGGVYSVTLEVEDALHQEGNAGTVVDARWPISASISATPTAGPGPLSVDLTATASGGFPDYLHTWDFNEDGASDASGAATSHVFSVSRLVRLSVLDSYGYVVTRTVAIQVSQPFSVHLSADPQVGHIPLTVQFNTAPSGGTPPYSYAWDLDGDGALDSTVPNPSHVYEAFGRYDAQVWVTDNSAAVASEHLVIEARLPRVNLQLVQLDTSEFPVLAGFARVRDMEGDPIEGLTEANFSLTEQTPWDPAPVREQIDVQPQATGTGGIAVALVIDKSGSMAGTKIAAAKVAAQSWVGNMVPADRAAVIAFADAPSLVQAYTGDVNALRTAIDTIVAGGSTAVYDALLQAISETASEVGIKAVIIFSDGIDNASSATRQEVIDAAVASSIPLFTIGLGTDVNEDDLIELADGTGGYYAFAPSAADLADIYAEISAMLKGLYLVTYETHDATFEHSPHTVTLTCTVGADWDVVTRTYGVSQPPVIQLTAQTLRLMAEAQPEYQALPITARITDDSGIESATLFYRRSGAVHYSQVPMTTSGGGLYRAFVPQPSVLRYGVDFYLVASDGMIPRSEPPFDAESHPHQVAVLPNGAPTINHDVIASAVPNLALVVEALVTDEDDDPSDAVGSVQLNYRPGGGVLYTTQPMSHIGGDTYRASIPAAAVTMPGVEYYLAAADTHGVRSYHGTEALPHFVDVGGSTIEATPDTVDADGVSTSHVVLTLRDADGAPAVAIPVRLLGARGPSDRFDQPAGTTDSNGQFAAEVSSFLPGSTYLQARRIDQGTNIADAARVLFLQVPGMGNEIIPPDEGAPIYVTDLTARYRISGHFPHDVQQAFPWLFGGLDNTVTAHVDWRGQTPGTVEFCLNDSCTSVTARGSEVSHTYDGFDQLLEPGYNNLTVTAFNADQSLASPPRVVMPTAWDPPVWLLVLGPVAHEVHWESDPLEDTATLNAGISFPPSALSDAFSLPLPGDNGLDIGFSAELDIPIGEEWDEAELSFKGGATVGADSDDNPLLGSVAGQIGFFDDVQASISFYVQGTGAFDEELSPYLSEIGAGVSAEFEATKSWSVLIVLNAVPGFGPGLYQTISRIPGLETFLKKYAKLYIKIAPTLVGEGMVGLQPDVHLEHITLGIDPFDLEGGVKIDFKVYKLNPYLGVGGSLVFGYPPLGLERYGIYGKAGFKVVALVWEASWEARVEWSWQREHDDLAAVLPVALITPVHESGWQLIQPNYGAGPIGRFASGVDVLPAAQANPDGSPATQVIVSNVYPEARPALARRSDGSAILVWTHEDLSLPVGQRQEIYFSRLSGGSWSVPARVESNTLMDFYPQLAFDQTGNAVAVWTRLNDPAVPPEAGLEPQWANKVELVTARFDAAGGVWATPTLLTQNNCLDYVPELATGSDGVPILTWRRNCDGLVGGAGDELLVSTWNGMAWTAPAVVLSGVTGLHEVDVARHSAGRAALAYSRWHTVGGQDRLRAYTVQYDGSTWGSPVLLSNTLTVDHAAPQITYDAAGHPIVVWQAGNSLVRRDLDTGDECSLSDAATTGLHGFELLPAADGNLAVIWGGSLDGHADLFLSIFDETHQVWGQPAALTDDPDSEGHAAPVWAGNDALLMAYARTAITYQTVITTVNGQAVSYTVPIEGQSDLVTLDTSLVRDLTVLSSTLAFTPTMPGPGGLVTISIEVHNAGDLALADVVVAFYDGAPEAGGVLIDQVALPDPLAAGSSALLSVGWTLPISGGQRQLVVVVDPDDVISESNEANNRAARPCFGPDLSLIFVSADVWSPGDVDLRTAAVNDGTTAAPETIVAFLRGGITGTLATSVTVPVLEPGQAIALAAHWEPAIPLTGTTRLVAMANPGGAGFDETNLDNNTAETEASLLPDLCVDGALLAGVPQLDGGTVVTAAVYNLGTAPASEVGVRLYEGDPLSGGRLLHQEILAEVPILNSPTDIAVVVFSANLAGGPHLVYVWVDPDNQTREQSNANNIAARQILVPHIALGAGLATPSLLTATEGSEVYWRNLAGVTQTVTATGMSWAWESGGLDPGEMTSCILDGAPGTYTFTTTTGAAGTLVVVGSLNVTGVTPDSFANDAPVLLTVTGSGFASGMTAGLRTPAGDLPLGSVLVVNSATLQAEVPAGLEPGRYALWVRSAAGLEAGLARAVTIGRPGPTLTAIAPGTAALDQDVLLTINGTGLAAGAMARLESPGGIGYPLRGQVVTPTSTIQGRLPALPVGTYDVVVYNPDGQSATLPASFTVTPGRPLAAFGADGRGGVAPLTVRFTNLSQGDISSYRWDFGDASPINTALAPTHVYTTGVYTVTLQVAGTGGTDSRIEPWFIVVAQPAWPTVEPGQLYLPLLYKD